MPFSLRSSAARVFSPGSGLTRENVITAYQLLLGRKPENEEVVRWAMRKFANFDELRKGFMASEEYAGLMTTYIFGRRFPLDQDQGEVIEVYCDDADLARLLAHVEATWRALGDENPYWSVLSTDAFRKENFEQNQETYWASGNHDVARMQRWLERNHVSLPKDGTCLEFGCGTGRVTRFLSSEFRSVIACDISESHLQLARQAAPGPNVEFLHVNRISALDSLPPFDFLFTMIVLQHNPPPVIAYVLEKLLRALRPGGVAYFQVPTACRDYRFLLSEYLAEKVGKNRKIEMHFLPQRYVFEIAARNGCEPVEVNPDNMTGLLKVVSTTFLLRKTANR